MKNLKIYYYSIIATTTTFCGNLVIPGHSIRSNIGYKDKDLPEIQVTTNSVLFDQLLHSNLDADDILLQGNLFC